jgi:AcrR family transcriptional regulator
MNKSNARHHILRVAESIVAERGASELSFDNLSKAANLSRGGILYHFESKEILIAAMLEDLTTRFEVILEDEMAQDDKPHGRFTRAFARATFRMDAETSAVFSGIIAAVSYQPALLEALRERWETWQARSEAELDFATAAVVRLASHAIWLGGIFGMNSYTSEQLRNIVAKLESLTIKD